MLSHCLTPSLVPAGKVAAEEDTQARDPFPRRAADARRHRGAAARTRRRAHRGPALGLAGAAAVPWRRTRRGARSGARWRGRPPCRGRRTPHGLPRRHPRAPHGRVAPPLRRPRLQVQPRKGRQGWQRRGGGCGAPAASRVLSGPRTCRRSGTFPWCALRQRPRRRLSRRRRAIQCSPRGC